MKNFICALLFISIPTILWAQRPKPGEIESMKIAFFTSKLDLSPQEAKVFWPIYNDMQAEQSSLRKERMKKMISFKKVDEIDNLSDSQVQSLITSEFDFKQRELDTEKKYYNKLRAALPIKTVGKYYRALEGFKRELLNKYRNHH
ncbi:hypothetical protein ABIB40_001533 [Pedobacter sp. UYP30]|uniref:hypothetical protein n=1 Tax=Pedobacter sp. UYP30 TaxID=1756400 RepID=UPI0033954CD7